MSFAVVPAMTTVEDHALVPTEQAFIQILQPRLNYPFIAKWFVPSKGIIRRVPIQRIDGRNKAKGFETRQEDTPRQTASSMQNSGPGVHRQKDPPLDVGL